MDVNVLDHLVSRNFHRINTMFRETVILPKTQIIIDNNIETVRKKKKN